MVTRLSRVEQVERNRALVLDAARRVFLRRGYTGATVDGIAEEAGFSKGVVYSQFAGKPDLFFALLEERIAERAAQHAAVAADHTGLDGLRALLRASARTSEESRDWGRLVIEFRVVAAREPELNRRYAQLHEGVLDRLAEAIRTVLSKGGLVPAYPARALAELIMSIDAGSVLEQAAGTAVFDRRIVLADLVPRLVEPI